MLLRAAACLPPRTLHGGGARPIITIRQEPQLTLVIPTPALDTAIRRYRASVADPQGDGGGGDACRHRGSGEVDGI